MDQTTLLEILQDQKAELSTYSAQNLCHRAEESQIKLTSKKAQVVIGVRRSGKSVLCYNALSQSGVNYAYVNFDDERLFGLNSDDLNDILRCLYQIYGDFTHLFLDEAQNVDGWHLFVNRMLRNGMKIVITGSNAKLLSSELSTHLTGRYNEIKLFPFSFKEYCAIKKVNLDDNTTKGDAFIRRAFDEYLQNGAFPEIATGEEDPERYIDLLVSNILERDIINRFKVRYKEAFRNIANHLMNNAPCEVVCDSLKTIFGLKNSHTVENYVSYLYQAYLLMQLRKYSPKSSERIRNAKCYTIDVALMSARKDAFAKENLGWRLETIVYLELCRRYPTGYDIYYYKDGTTECDFLVCHRSTVIEAIQVSYDISEKKVYAREIKGLQKAFNVTRCPQMTLITAYDEGSEKLGESDVSILPCYKWLLGK